MNKPLQSALLAIFIFAINCGGNNAYAYSLSNFIKQAEVIKVNAVTSATSTAIKVSTTIRGFAANDPYYIRNIEVPKTSFMSHVKGNVSSLAKRNAWYAAWLATMAAAGWAIDELKNQVVSKPKNYEPGIFYYIGNYGQYNNFAAATPDYSCKSYLTGNSTWGFDSVKTPVTGSYGVCVAYKLTSPTTKQEMIRIYQTSCSAFPASQVSTCTGSDIPYEPVPDDSIYESLISKMLQDPNAAAQAFMVPDPYPYPYPNIFPSQVPYIPGVAQTYEEALDCYFKGILQSTNPNAPYYVTPDRYQQIASLAQQLQQGITPEAQTDAMNQQLKSPLTQKQLEESLKKEREAQDKATKDALGEKPNLDTLLDPYKSFEQDVKGTPNNQVNQLPSNTFSIGGSGQCYVFDKSYSIMGASWTLSTRQFCDAYYYPYFLPILTWFFYCCTGLYIWFSLRDAFARRV